MKGMHGEGMAVAKVTDNKNPPMMHRGIFGNRCKSGEALAYFFFLAAILVAFFATFFLAAFFAFAIVSWFLIVMTIQT